MMFKYLLSPQTVPHSPSDDNGGTTASAMAEEKDEISSPQLEVADDENCHRDSQSPDLPETAPPESIDATNSQVKLCNRVE